MQREVANHIQQWNTRLTDHIEKQLHNPFSEWSQGEPKKPVTSPTGVYPRLPFNRVSRSTSPVREENPSLFNPLNFQPSAKFTQKPFNQNTLSPSSPKPSANQATGFAAATPLSRGQYRGGEDTQSYNEPGREVDFLNRVKKWRKPGTEPIDLVPLSKAPEPVRRPTKEIKVKVPIPPIRNDPLSERNFSPVAWQNREEEEKPYSPPVVEHSKSPIWRKQAAEEEFFKFKPTKPVRSEDVSKAVPGWSPMGKTFAKIVGGRQTINEDIYYQNGEYDDDPSNLDPDAPIGYFDSQSLSPNQFYTGQSEETNSSEMNFRRQDMSSQISQWQQRVQDHERKQLLNPFSEWEGASHHAKLSKTDARYGKPIEGSMTQIRGMKANTQVHGEVEELCQIISDLGDRQPDNSVVIKFGALFQAYTRISNKLVGMLMRARKQDLVHFNGEMLFQGRDDDVEIKLLKAVDRYATESAVGINSGCGVEARSSGGAPADIKKLSAPGKEAITSEASTSEMLSRSDSANSSNVLMKTGSSSVCSSSTMNEGSSMSMMEESLGSSKMMSSSSSNTQMMSKEDNGFSTKMMASSANASKMMSKEESTSSSKMFSESSSSMKMLKEEGTSQMLGTSAVIGDSTKMLAGMSISPGVTPDSLMGSLKSGDLLNSLKIMPGDGNMSQQLLPREMGTLSGMSTSSDMLSSSTQQASSSSSSSMMTSKQMSTASEQMSMASSEQISSAMENMSVSSAENKQMQMSSKQMSSKQMSTEQMCSVTEQMAITDEHMSNRQMSSATEQMSMSNMSSQQQMSSSSSQMSSSSSQMSKVSDFSKMSTSDMMTNLLDDSFSKVLSAQGSTSTTSGSILSSQQQSSSSKVLSKTFSSFESSSVDTSLMGGEETHSILSSDLKQIT